MRTHQYISGVVMVVAYNAIKVINKTVQSLNKQKIKNRLSVYTKVLYEN